MHLIPDLIANGSVSRVTGCPTSRKWYLHEFGRRGVFSHLATQEELFLPSQQGSQLSCIRALIILWEAHTSKYYSYCILTMRCVQSNDFQLWGMNYFSPHFTNEKRERKHFSKVINSSNLTLKSVLTSIPYSFLKYFRSPWKLEFAGGCTCIRHQQTILFHSYDEY